MTWLIFMTWIFNAFADQNAFLLNQTVQIRRHRVNILSEPLIIKTFGGSGSNGYDGDGGPVINAGLPDFVDIYIDSNYNMYITDCNGHIVRVVDKNGIINTFAGTISGHAGDDGPADQAQLNCPYGITGDSNGNLYFSENGGQILRMVSPTKVIKTIAGVPGQSGYLGDGDDPLNALLSSPAGVWVDSLRQIYISDSGNSVIRFIDVSGFISTLIGTGNSLLGGDNLLAVETDLNSPLGLWGYPNGDLLIADQYNNVVRRYIAATGICQIIAGTGGSGGITGNDGPATLAKMWGPAAVFVDGEENIFIADPQGNQIRKVAKLTGIITVLAGTGWSTNFNGDGADPKTVLLNYPRDVYADTNGKVFILEVGNYRIRSIDGGAAAVAHSPSFVPTKAPIEVPQGDPPTVNVPNFPTEGFFTMGGTGSNTYSGDGGPFSSAGLSGPGGIYVDSNYYVYISDYTEHMVRMVDLISINPFAGSHTMGYTGDNGPALQAKLFSPAGLTGDLDGNIYICDMNNHAVRVVMASTGKIKTVAGCGTQGYTGDNGPATNAKLFQPLSVAVDSDGNVFISDSANYVIRRVDISTGFISTFIGTGSIGFGLDDVPPLEAGLNFPYGIFGLSTGDLFIVDSQNFLIRKYVHATGKVKIIAGDGVKSNTGDNGLATDAHFVFPMTVYVDTIGNIFICDFSDSKIRRIDHSTDIITTYAGTGVAGFNGETGEPTTAMLASPRGVYGDVSGNIYIVDAGNYRARVVVPPPVPIPSSIPSGQPSSSPTQPAPLGIITTVTGDAGTSNYGGDGGPLLEAEFAAPSLIYENSIGDLFIIDETNNVIRKASLSDNVIKLYAGVVGGVSYTSDGGNALTTPLGGPAGLTGDSNGNLFVTDRWYCIIRKISPSDGLTKVAGTASTCSNSGDNGDAMLAGLNVPKAIWVDSQGDLFFSDSLSFVIRKIEKSTNIISKYIGAGGYGNLAGGDNVPPLSVVLSGTNGISGLPNGDLYFTDVNVLRKFSQSTNKVTIVAGTKGLSGNLGDDGPATSARFKSLSGLWIAKDSRVIYVSDSTSNVVRKITSSGIINAVAGTGTAGFSGDGNPGTSAKIKSPYGLAGDSLGRLWIVDSGNFVVRMITIEKDHSYSPTSFPSGAPSTAPTDIIPNTDFRDNLLLYLPFYDGELTDHSGNHLQIINFGGASPVNDRFSRSNSAYFIRPSSYLSVTYNSIFDIGTSDYSICAWIEIVTPSASGRIVSHGADSGNSPGYMLRLDCSVSCHLVQSAVCSTDHVVNFVQTGTTSLTLGKWYFVVSTVDRSGMASIYVNGVLDSASSFSPVNNCDLSYMNQPFFIF
jgi:streptogramin lyase